LIAPRAGAILGAMSTRVESMVPMLSVEDLERSARFYTDLLGGTESYRFPDAGPAVFVSLRLGTSELGLGQIGPGGALHGEAQRPAHGHRIELCVYVDDVDAAVERMREAGTRIVVEPADQPWGERIAYVADPDGNLLMLTRRGA
jgi:lactoylglutathione lyase